MLRPRVPRHAVATDRLLHAFFTTLVFFFPLRFVIPALSHDFIRSLNGLSQLAAVYPNKDMLRVDIAPCALLN